MGTSRFSLLPLLAVAMLLVSSHTWADDTTKAVEEGPKLSDRLLLDHGKLTDTYRRFKSELLKLAELIRKEDPQRATLLEKAVSESSKRGVHDQLSEILELLDSDLLRDLDEVSNRQSDVEQDMQLILKLLLTENRADQNRSEQQRVKEYIKEIDRAIKRQRELRTRGDRGGDAKRLGKRQGNLADRMGDLAERIQENEESSGDSSEGESKEGESKQDRDKDSEGESSDGESSEGESSDGKQSEGESGEGKSSDGKSSDGQPSKGQPSDGKSASGEPGEQDGKSGEESSEGNDKEPGDSDNEGADKEASDKEGKPGEESESGDSKSDKSSDGNSDGEKSDSDASPQDMNNGEPSDGQPSQGQPSQGQPSPGQPSQGQPSPGQPSQGEGQPQEQQPPQKDAFPARERIQAATEKMREAEKKLKEAKQNEAKKPQEEALAELERAKRELEEILRQMREEEMEKTLAMLEGRFRKMLEMQQAVYDATVQLDKKPADERDRADEIEADRLARKEVKIIGEVDKALVLLREDGTAVALPEAVRQIREDMEMVAERLTDAKVGKLTQGVETDIIAALEEIIAALEKARKDLKEGNKPPPPPPGMQAGEPGDPPLVDSLAELKMIRALQMRVNRRTEQYKEMIDTKEVEADWLAPTIRRLADREERIHRITRDIILGKNR